MDANEKSELNSIEEQRDVNKSCGIDSSVYEPEILPDSLQAPYNKKRTSKKIIIPIVAVVALILALGLFKIFASPTITEISLSKASLNLNFGDSVTIDYTIDPENASDVKLVWSSSDESVATVDEEGKVTAVGGGTCTITATAQDKTASLSVSVTQLSPEESAIIGSWKSKAAIIDGKPSYGGATVNLALNEDFTGHMSVGDANIDFEWKYSKTDDETFVYNCYATDGSRRTLTYDIEAGEETIVFVLDVENALLFVRR